MKRNKDFEFIGALVLGMHDALVELGGIIAGLTFAIDSCRIIVMTAIIAAAAASLSMAAANYQAERCNNNPAAGKAAMYTGIMYITTSAMLIFPYTVIPNKFWALSMMSLIAVLIIFGFNCAIGRTTQRPFIKRVTEMLVICMGVAIASFAIGAAARHFLGVNI